MVLKAYKKKSCFQQSIVKSFKKKPSLFTLFFVVHVVVASELCVFEYYSNVHCAWVTKHSIWLEHLTMNSR